MKDIVLDTNCLLMSLPRLSPYRKAWDAFLLSQFCLCFTTEILEEYEEIIGRKTTPQIARNVIKVILERPNTKRITVYYKFSLVNQDPDDNKFVDCAIAAGANYIVTNDRHFDEVRACPFPNIGILTLSEFCEQIGE